MKLTEQFKQFWSNKLMAKEATKNYTDEMVAEMIKVYTANPTRESVDLLANQFGKSVRNSLRK